MEFSPQVAGHAPDTGLHAPVAQGTERLPSNNCHPSKRSPFGAPNVTAHVVRPHEIPVLDRFPQQEATVND